MISDDAAEKAVDFLRESAEKASEARGNVVLLEQMLKVTRARLKSMSSVKTDSGREDEAMSSPEYLEIVKGYQAAVEADSLYRMKREAATARIEAWRTQQSNLRAMGK